MNIYILNLKDYSMLWNDYNDAKVIVAESEQ